VAPYVNWVERLWVVLRLHKNLAKHFQSVYYLKYQILKVVCAELGDEDRY
jgi:hypothetical protein